jgi:hypothetical protein
LKPLSEDHPSRAELISRLEGLEKDFRKLMQDLKQSRQILETLGARDSNPQTSAPNVTSV